MVAPSEAKVDQKLVKSIIRAHAWLKTCLAGATRPSKISLQQRTSIRKLSGKDFAWRF